MANIVHSLASGIHPGAYVASSAPTPSQDGVLWVDTSSGPPYALKTWDAGSASWKAVGTGGAAGTITYHYAALSADVAMATNSTFYGGPSVTCAAGSWIIIGGATVTGSAGGNTAAVARIWDGAASKGSAQAFINTSQTVSLTAGAAVTPGSSTTYTVQASNTGNNATLRAATNNPSAQGNNATWILAVQMA